MEASGRNYRKLEVSVYSMEVFTTSMEAPTTSMIFMEKIILRFVKLAKIV